jgi:hypothetical protein
MNWEVILGAWVAVGLSLCMYSFLYKDNPYFKFGEHLFVGVSIGYSLVRLWYDVMDKQFLSPLREQGDWTLLIPAGLGILILARFVPSLSWLSRISFAFIVGFGSGVAIPRTISSFILQQIEGTLKPFATLGQNASLWPLVNAILILIGVISVLCYFFFSLEHRGVLLRAARLGIYFLMISFGGAFGYTVMARMSLLIGRFDDLILYSAKSYGYATPILLVAIAIGLSIWERNKKEQHQTQ